MSRAILWSWCAVPALLLAACGGGAPSGPSGEINSTQAASFKSTGGETTLTLSDPGSSENVGGLFAADGYSRRSVTRLLNNSLRTLGRGERTSCNLNKGSITDADTDDIRDASTDTYNCDFSGGSSSFTLALSGGTTVKDDLVDATTGKFPKGGATVKPDLTLTMSGSGEGGSFSGTVLTKGLWNFLLADLTASGKIEITQNYNISAGGQSVVGEISFYLSPWTVTPTDIADPLKAGTVSWKSYFVYNLQDVAYTLEATTKDLVYDRTCVGGAGTNAAKYTGGSISWIDGASNTVKVSFASNCTPTWTFNDTAI